MDSFLKGNYALEKKTENKEKKAEKDLSGEFESKAIEKLGGSIAFVSKSKLLWSGENEEKTD